MASPSRAAAPTGNARWTPPTAPTPPAGTVTAGTPGDACPSAIPAGDNIQQSEDCLVLNVWVPANATPGAKLPVLFWIHGGALTFGTGATYDPSSMVAESNMVVVTINYRLGALGFLVEPGLVAAAADAFETAGDAGNYGLMDQQFAMQWVQNNIAKFCGDPTKVTISGESAGGLSVTTHLTSTKLAAGLFRGAIIESGPYMLHDLPSQSTYASLFGAAFDKDVGCTQPNDAACLRGKSVEAVLTAPPSTGSNTAIEAPTAGPGTTATSSAGAEEGGFSRFADRGFPSNERFATVPGEMTVSYCIPLYNKERYLAGVLDAALAERAQTGGEVLVYDDASTDGSAAIAAARPVTLIRGTANRGVLAATALLIERAAEPYLRIVDADDRILPGSTAHLLALVRRHGAMLALGTDRADDAPAPVQDFPAAAAERVEPRPLRSLLRNVDFNLSAGVMPADAARAVLPLPTELRTAQDVCVALRLAKRGCFVRSPALVMLQPTEQTNRLSRRLAQMYRDICLITADELAERVTSGDAAYAVRRQAARCARYFRREAPGGLGIGERAWLARCRLATGLEPIALQTARLRVIAGLFGRDAQRVLA
jgi:hypothetical protein